jgi:hypothetical protein
MHAQSSGRAARTRGRLAVVTLLPLLMMVGCKQSSTTEPASAAGEGEFVGSLDVVTGEQIAGWAWNPTQPDTPIKVDILDGDKNLTTVLADQPRDDLLKEKKGNGKHGFSIATPASLKDGKPHTIRAKVQGTSHELAESPKTLKAP